MDAATRRVTVLPATINPATRLPVASAIKRRVAAYARVSTDSDEQFTSYEAQIDYYTRYIKSREDWDFVTVYTDEGISGTNTKHRDGFNQMIRDALAGKIDLIVTKSVSRFARNTVDSLVTVRKLKDKGVEVFFEKENIYTLDSKGELLITIMSSLAQEESRSLSENVTWGQRKRFSDGKVSLPYSQFLGYRKGADGLPEIVPEEAEVVRRIYQLFMWGNTAYGIAAQLTADGIPTPSGKANWSASTIKSILTNEKYKGDALLQKGFTVDFLTHKRKMNEGEVQQYYVKNSHPAIIPPDEWNMVQHEIERRKVAGRRYSGNGVLASRIVCGDCGGFYSPKTWHSTDKYRKVVYRCQRKYQGEHRCMTPAMDETTIQERFLSVINEVLAGKQAVVEDCQTILTVLTDHTELDGEITRLRAEIDVVAGLARQHIEANSQTAMNQKEYMERYDGYVERYERLKHELEEREGELQRRMSREDALRDFMSGILAAGDAVTAFDPKLWVTTIEKATVMNDGQIEFAFRNGVKVVA